MPKPSRSMKRRRFVKLLALSGGALAVGRLARAAEVVTKHPSKSSTRAIRREIEKQQKSLAEQLDIIRKYELPPGSPMAFSFVVPPVPYGRPKRGRS